MKKNISFPVGVVGVLSALCSIGTMAMSSVPDVPEETDLLSGDGYEIFATYESYDSKAASLSDDDNRSSWSNLSNEIFYDDIVSIDFKKYTSVNSIVIDADVGKTINLEYFDGADWQIASALEISWKPQSFSFQDVSSTRFRLRFARDTYSNAPVPITINEITMKGETLDYQPGKSFLDGRTVTEISRAPVDECYFGMGDPRNIYPKNENEPCPSEASEKTNEGYVWALTSYVKDDIKNLIIGTGANVYCQATTLYLEMNIPYVLSQDIICEMGSSTSSTSEVGDQRPPSIYIYDINTNQRRKIIPDARTEMLLSKSLGLRAAEVYKGIAFMAGPNLNKGVTMVALNAATGEILGSTSYESGFTSVRRMLEFKDEFYMSVGSGTLNIENGAGAVIRWEGDADAILNGDTSSLFDFKVVGTGLNAEATELTALGDKLLVSTWPSRQTDQGGGLWLSDDLQANNDPSDDIVLWSSATTSAAMLELQDNGNLRLLNAAGEVLFESATGGKGVTKALLQNSGELVLYGVDGVVVWSSDSEYAPVYPEMNQVATENAFVLTPGTVLTAGQSVTSENKFITLTLTESGELKITRQVLPYTRIWGAEDYEPDPLMAKSYGIGQVVEHDGWMYWGTLHVPASSLYKVMEEFSSTSVLANITPLLQGFHRGTQLFRGRNLGTANQEIELLYGGYAFNDEGQPGEYPVHQARKSSFGFTTGMGDFKFEMNKMNQVPKYGKGGLNNHLNQYLWSLVKFNGDLYMGTFDLTDIYQTSLLSAVYGGSSNSTPGADFYKLENGDMSLEPVFLDGAGNPDSYGIRNAIVVDGVLYLGTATNTNLGEGSGWRLLKMTVEDSPE